MSRLWDMLEGSHFILIRPLQMDTVTKNLIKMRPLSTDGAILILVLGSWHWQVLLLYCLVCFITNY